MTDTTITQADREEAARCEESLHALYGASAAKRTADITRAGGRDNGKWVKEFARHRREARAEALEEAAKVAEGVAGPLFAEAKAMGLRDVEGMTLRMMQGDGAQAAAEAIRALSLSQRG